MSSKQNIRSGDHYLERKMIRKIPFSYDPIGRHIIALRKFYRKLENYKELLNLKRSPGPVPKIPEYPPDYPTFDYLQEVHKKKLRTIRQFHFKGRFSSEEIEKMRIFAIKKILLQSNYYTQNMEDDDECLTFLSNLMHIFIQSFITRLRFHKDSAAFCESEDLYDPLETTLQEWGIGGISGIAKYFYDQFVRMHDALYSDCEKELQLINRKYLVQNEMPNSTMNPDLPSTSMSALVSSSSKSPDLPSTSTTLPNPSVNPDLPSTSTTLPSFSVSPDLQNTSTALPDSLMSQELPSSSMNPDVSNISTALK